MFQIRTLGCLALTSLALLMSSGTVVLAANPSPAAILGRLHDSNRKQIQLGQLARKHGQSRDVISLGKVLIQDHMAADDKVLALARQNKIELPSAEHDIEKRDMSSMSGADFDAKLAREILDDYRKDVAEATTARDTTTDHKLKNLLTELVVTLQKHLDMVQSVVDGQQRTARN